MLGWAEGPARLTIPRSGFAAHATEGIDLRGKVTASVGGMGSRARTRYQAGLYELQPVEEAGDLFGAAEVVRERSTFVVALLGLGKRLADDVGAVVERQVAARGEGIQQPLHDRPGLVMVTHMPQDSHQHERDRLAE